MPKKKTTKQRTKVNNLPTKGKKLSKGDMKKVKGGLTTEMGMPALDAGSKDAAKFTVKFKP